MRSIDYLFKAPVEVRVVRKNQIVRRDSPYFEEVDAPIVNAWTPAACKTVPEDLWKGDFRFLQFCGIGGSSEEVGEVHAVVMHPDGQVMTTWADNVRFTGQ